MNWLVSIPRLLAGIVLCILTCNIVYFLLKCL